MSTTGGFMLERRSKWAKCVNRLTGLEHSTLFLFGLLALGTLVRPWVTEGYHPDIDHELYFGLRLLHGELIWEKEFQDKLPGLQIFFSLVFLAGGLDALVAVNQLAVLLAASCFALTMPLVWRRMRPSMSRHVLFPSLMGAFGFIALTGISPNAYAHISALPAAFTFVFMQLTAVVAAGVTVGHGKYLAGALGLFSGFLVALAVSIRPYSLVPILLFSSLAFGSTLLKARFASRGYFFFLSIAGFSSVMLGFALNTAPYLMQGETSAFLFGLEFLGQGINPENGWLKLWSSPLVWVTLGLLIFGALVPAFYQRRKDQAELLGWASAIAGLGLLATFGSLHWWGHYGPLLAPFSAYGVFLGIAALSQPLDIRRFRPKEARALVLTAFIGLSTATPFVAGFSPAATQYIDSGSQSLDEREGLLRVVSRELAAYDADSSFLFVESMYVHWRLDMSRHGFPHSANSQHIMQGWWKQTQANPESGFLAPRNAIDYCGALNERGPSVILTQTNALQSCLSAEDSQYSLAQITSGFTIFVRQ